MENFETQQSQSFGGTLPKPILEEDKKNWVRKSLISLAIYAILFKFIFDLELVYIAAVLVVLLIHEFGHFFAMKFFNYTNVKMFVLPLLGAYVTGTKKIISQRQMSIVILAGPVPGILIGLGLLSLDMYYPNDKVQMLGNIFVGLNFFNLLPFMPLDGGRLLETLFINHNHSIRVIFTIISILFLLLFALQSIFFLIIPISMAFDLYMEIKNQKIRDFLKQENINYFSDYQDLPDKDYWLIRDGILLSFSKRYNGIKAGVQQYSPIEGSIIQHVMAVLKLPVSQDLKFIGKTIFLIIFLVSLILPIAFYIPKFIQAIQQIQP